MLVFFKKCQYVKQCNHKKWGPYDYLENWAPEVPLNPNTPNRPHKAQKWHQCISWGPKHVLADKHTYITPSVYATLQGLLSRIHTCPSVHMAKGPGLQETLLPRESCQTLVKEDACSSTCEVVP